jgi:hypothetical protein
MFMQGCPATGCMSHRFDPLTHRCICGRWERGYAPKKEPARPRAECQICERQQAIDIRGCLGHHGYKRPGWGFIEGDCMGVGHKPYPETDALKLYAERLAAYTASCRAQLAALPSVTGLPFRYGRKEETTVLIVKGKPLPKCDGYCVPTFDDLRQREQFRLEHEIEQAARETARVEKRIRAAVATATNEDTRMTDELTTPTTEIEIAELLAVVVVLPHSAPLTLTVRRLAFERGQLLAQRDALLAAAERVINHYQDARGNLPGATFDALRAAIAQCKESP